MLAVLKIVREFPAYFHEDDNMEDAIGYMSLIEEIRETEGPQPPENPNDPGYVKR
jgi:hypothetical protein